MLNQEKRQVEIKLMHQKAILEDFRSGLTVKQDIFKQSNDYTTLLHEQLRTLESDTSKLALENRQL